MWIWKISWKNGYVWPIDAKRHASTSLTTDASIVFLWEKWYSMDPYQTHKQTPYPTCIVRPYPTTTGNFLPHNNSHIVWKKTKALKPCLRMCCIKGERYQIQSIIGRGIQQNICRLKGSKFLTNSQVTATQQSEGPRWGELGPRFLMAKK